MIGKRPLGLPPAKNRNGKNAGGGRGERIAVDPSAPLDVLPLERVPVLLIVTVAVEVPPFADPPLVVPPMESLNATAAPKISVLTGDEVA